jgi:Mg2+ and Co2+ transporter CorA
MLFNKALLGEVSATENTSDHNPPNDIMASAFVYGNDHNMWLHLTACTPETTECISIKFDIQRPTLKVLIYI